MHGISVVGRYTSVREAVQAHFEAYWKFCEEDTARAERDAKERGGTASQWRFLETDEFMSRVAYAAVMKMLAPFEFMPPGERKEQGVWVSASYSYGGDLRVKVEPATVAD